MRKYEHIYIDGQWVKPIDGKQHEVINPATGEVSGTVAFGGEADAVRAIEAAHRAFASYSRTTPKERIDLLRSICNVYEKRLDDIAQAITEEMGAPLDGLSRPLQAVIGLAHFQTAVAVAEKYEFERKQGTTVIAKEPIGVCSLITPWNWPMNQVTCKVAPALAVGCTVVLKPSQLAPYCALIFTEVLHEAGVPAGVYNMLNGEGAKLGHILSSHPLVEMVSLTGSTQAGATLSKEAADTIKKMSLELGGKSANIILDDADFDKAVTEGVQSMMRNTGQTCTAPSRMLVPAHRMDEVEKIAAAACANIVVGDPLDSKTQVGPAANKRQFEKVQSYIEKGIQEGAKLLCGGPGKPAGLERGLFIKPTIFSRVDNKMVIAQEEIFGPVLAIIPYKDEDDAINIANDSPFGLSGYVSSGSVEHAHAVARRMRTGMVHLNGAGPDVSAPFGGYKQSGLGREWGAAGFEEFVETKAVMGVQ
jgi:acyl-CoA reductase-like NAD-dependent aldehyde dehydrogenase